MEYNDEAYLDASAYEQMAKAYSAELKKRGFIFIKLDDENYKPFVDDVFSIMNDIKSSLFYLGNFLGTGAIYTLNEKQIENIELLLGFKFEPMPFRHSHDKTKCFLGYLGLESKLILSLRKLSARCPYSRQIEEMIDERLKLTSRLFSIKSPF